MKILFSVHHLGSFRMYESVVRALAQRGHEVHLAIGRAEALGWERTLASLVADHPNVRHSWIEVPLDGFWTEAGKTIRLWADYLRYLAPEYANTPKLRERAGERLPPALRALADRPLFADATWRARLRSVLRASERALPRSRTIDEFLAEEQPDLLLITPLVYLASGQMDVLRSAIAAGIRTAFCVGSWDHLSSKALLREQPQRVFVWNDTQKREAVDLHHVPESQVVVTGAQCYDQWFGRQPSRSREAFLRRVGLPADRPFLLYVGSALFRGSPMEAEFAARWLDALRSSENEQVRNVPVLLRPHPARLDEWNSVDFTRYPDVVVYGSNPVDDSSKDDYFEALYYSAAIVGLNTSAFIEGAIVGRPVLTVLLPEFWENQEGTLHFHYLFEVGGGVLKGARSFAEHHGDIARALAPTEAAPGRGFVQAFVRPHGLDVRATEIFVEQVEAMAHLPKPAPAPERARDVLMRWLVLAPVLLAGRRLFGAAVMRTDWTERAKERERVREEAHRHKAARLAERQRRADERERLANERRQARDAAWRQKNEERAERERAAQEAVRQREAARVRKVEEKERAIAQKAQDKEARLRSKERARRRARLKGQAAQFVKRLFASQGGHS